MFIVYLDLSKTYIWDYKIYALEPSSSQQEKNRKPLFCSTDKDQSINFDVTHNILIQKFERVIGTEETAPVRYLLDQFCFIFLN